MAAPTMPAITMMQFVINRVIATRSLSLSFCVICWFLVPKYSIHFMLSIESMSLIVCSVEQGRFEHPFTSFTQTMV
jgi:hypothetical protein